MHLHEIFNAPSVVDPQSNITTELTVTDSDTLKYFNRCVNSSNPFLPRVSSVQGTLVSLERLQPMVSFNSLTSQVIDQIFSEPEKIDVDGPKIFNLISKAISYAIRYQAHNYIVGDHRHDFNPKLVEAIDLIHSISSDSVPSFDMFAFRGNQLVIVYPYGR